MSKAVLKTSRGAAMYTVAILLLAVLAISARLLGQEASVAASYNPVPLINQPLVPDAKKPGGASFKLTVIGTGFVSGSIVNWNGRARHTTFVNRSRLTASILASDIAKAGTASITVVNPAPGGGVSSPVFFEVTAPISPVLLDVAGSYTAGEGPSSIATADFNGDGKLDLVVANLYSNSVGVFLGNGDGTFKPQVQYGTVSYAQSVVVGDFNRDGKVDLAVGSGAMVSILLGNGDGTFKAHVDYATAGSAISLALGDFNNDGKLDLVVVDQNSNEVSVLLGNGDGTFQTHTDYAVGASPWSVGVGDFNQDNKLDLAVVNYNDATVSVLLGKGDGTFQQQVTYATGVQPISVAVGYLNRDSKLDLAVASFYGGTVAILLGNGDGTFQAHTDYGAGDVPYSVVMGDFNADGIVDLAVANNGSQTVSVLLGNGDGTFKEHVDHGAGSNPQSLAVGDFDADGRLDLAVANYSFIGSGGSVSVLLPPTGPNATLFPTSLSFECNDIRFRCICGGPQNVTLTNYGSTALNITSITINGSHFSQTNTCGTILAAGKSCIITVSWNDVTSTGILEVNDNAPGSPQTASLTGTAYCSLKRPIQRR